MDVQVVQNPDGTWRVTNVPIISTGIEYPLASGPTTFTESQLADAVAALEDPAIVEPRIKLGHTSEYNEVLIGDAEQAFGRVDASTMRLSDNGQTIYSDITGLPEWLAKVMAIAYPNRSIEGNFDIDTVTGRRYELVITAVSLLGIYWPGCQVLEDLPLWYGSSMPEEVQVSEEVAAQLQAAGGTVPTIKADADTSRIRRQFYDQAMSGGFTDPDGDGDTYWWWIRGERVADNGGLYLIVEDENDGDLLRIDVTVNSDNVEFGDPQPVTVEYPAKTAAARAAVVAGMRVVDPAIRVHASRADTDGPVLSTRKGASTMDEKRRKALAAALGLPESATLDQIRAASEEQLRQGVEGGEPDNAGLRGDEVSPEQQPPAHQTPPGTHPSGTGAGRSEEEEQQEVETAQRNQDDPEGNDDPDAEAGIVRVDRKTWEQTQAGAALAHKHEQEAIKARRAGVVTEAIKAGKIPPARRSHYLTLMAMDEAGTTEALASLQASAVPLGDVVGATGDGDEVNAGAGATAGLPDDWFPEVSARREAAARGHQPVMYGKEG